MTATMTTAEKFEAMYDLELEANRAHATEGFGIDAATRARAKVDKDKVLDQMLDLAATLTHEEAEAYGRYRLARKAAL